MLERAQRLWQNNTVVDHRLPVTPNQRPGAARWQDAIGPAGALFDRDTPPYIRFHLSRFNLIDGLSVLDNITLPAYPLGPDYGELRTRAKRLLAQFGLENKAANPINWLSGGEAQRVAICRALINDPAILIADEPTANLDSRLSSELMGLLDGLRESGKTVLVTSHDADVYESPVVDRVIGMRDGRLAEAGA